MGDDVGVDLIDSEMVRMNWTIVWMFGAFLGINTAFAGDSNKDPIFKIEKSFYASIEADIKEEFESAVATFKQQATNVTNQQLNEGMDVLKSLFYNKQT